MILALIGCLLRVIEYAIDPQNVRGIWGAVAEDIIFTAALVFWLAAEFTLQLYWLELQCQSGITQLYSIKKFRPLLLGLVAFTILVDLPITIWEASTNSFVATLVYDLFLIILLIAVILFSSIFGRRLYVFMNRYGGGQHRQMQVFLKKITRRLFIANALFIFIVLTLAAYDLFDAIEQPWLFTFLHLLFRTWEFLLLETTILFLRKKRPPVSADSSGASSGPVRVVHASSLLSTSTTGSDEFDAAVQKLARVTSNDSTKSESG